MKKSIKLIMLAVFIFALIFATKANAFQNGQLDANQITVTMQSTYLNNNEKSIAIALKNSNKKGENSNVLKKETLKSIIQQKYGKDLLSKVYKKDGTEVSNEERVGTGYKVELVTNEKLTVILYGDVNCDGMVDLYDTIAIAQHNVGTGNLDNYQRKAAKLTNASDEEISIFDTIRVACYNVDMLGTDQVGKNIVDEKLFPADEKLNTVSEVSNLNNAEETYKTALSKFTSGKFTSNNAEISLENGSLIGTVNYNFDVNTEIFPENEVTGYYFAYVLKVKGANENTTVKIKNGDKEYKIIEYSSFDVTTDGEEGISLLASLNQDADNKNIEIIVDLDGDGTLYEPSTQTISYESLQYEEVEQATITTNIPEADIKSLEGEDWKYRFEFEDEEDADEGYKIEKQEGNNKYKATGTITEQKDVVGFSGSAKTDFYVVFAIEPKHIYEGLQIQIPIGEGKYKTVGKEALVDGKLTAIISIDEDNKEENSPIKIKIDLDGDGSRFELEEIEIDYKDLKCEKSSHYEVQKELPTGKADAIKTKFQDEYGFKPEDYFKFIGGKDDLAITQDGLDAQLYKITGTLPKMTGVHAGFEGDDKGGYYIVFTVKMDSTGKTGDDNNINENVKVTLTSPATGESAKVRELGKESFDTATEMVVLWKLDDVRDDKTFKVTIDLDGDDESYAPYHVIFDYSDVVFQQESAAKISIDETQIPEEDKTQIQQWGYKLQSEIKLSEENEHVIKNKNEDNIKYDATTGLLSGIVKEQKLTGGFKDEDLDSYFYTFTIKPEEVTENIKITVENKDNEDEGNGGKKEFGYDDLKNGTLTILQHISKDFVKCHDSACCGEDGNCADPSKCEKSIKITIDVDGDGQYGYKPSKTYYMDFCNLDFVKLHTVSFKNADKTDVKLADGSSIKSVELYDGEKVTEPATPVKENGLDNQEYNKFSYWRKEGDEDYSKKFEFGQEDNKSTETIKDDITLNPMWEIDVDKYVTDAISKISDIEKEKSDFAIEKDDTKITVEIKDRNESIDSITDTGIAETIAHALMSDTIKEIDVELKDPNATLELKRAEIKAELSSGFNEEAIKENVTSKIKEYLKKTELSGSDSHTLDDLCTTCASKELELTIKPEESLANIKDKKATYQITFEKELMITFDAGILGTLDTQYEKNGTTVTDLPTPTIPKEEEPYREFEGWYKKGDSVKVTSIEEISEDTQLEAHYNLKVEKFMEDVIADLKNPDSEYSDNFTGQFELTQGTESKKNEITIQVQSPNVELSKLSETSIPGTIAYILQKGEIQDITLTVGTSNTKTFKKDAGAGVSAVGAQANGDSALDEAGEALKQKIITEAKSAFDDELKTKEASEETATMDQVEFEGTTFTLKIGEPIDTVNLVDVEGNSIAEKDTYTFNFDSTFTVIDKNDPIGPDTITEALSKNDYEKIYVESDIDEADTVKVNIQRDVTIEPIENFNKESGLMATAEDPKYTIKVNEKDYAIDVESTVKSIEQSKEEKTLTISDLKITGAKYGQLRVGTNATVNARNLDVSGKIEKSVKSETNDEMHASIVVDGKLTANDIKNNDETYSTPTIALVTNFSFPKSDVTGEEMESSGNKNLHPNAKVETSSKMIKNDKYHITRSEVAKGFDQIEEVYYGSFYYVKESNSQIYFMSIIDREIPSTALTFFKIYYYDEEVDITKLGYETGKAGQSGKKFQKLTVQSTGKDITADEKPRAQEVLKPHYSNSVSATYIAAEMNILQSNELSVTGNKVSGIISSKNEKGQYCIPVTLSSEHFEDDKSTVKVTNPNDVTTTYTYKSSNSAEIAPASAVNAMQLELEAIKSSNITGTNGKVYTIAVDVDGEETEYDEEVYTIDYNEVKTLEEKINNAAENTKNANNVTVKKNNKINGYTEKFDYMYDNAKGLMYTKSRNGDNVEEYSFSYKYAGIEGSKMSVVARKATGAHDDSKVYINDWEYIHPVKVGRAIQELTMLTDVMKDSHVYNAIDGVKKVENQAHTYMVTLNRNKYNQWVDDTYLANPEYTFKELSKDNKLEVQVELDEDEKFVKAIKTIEENAINKFDVTFEQINETIVEEPKEFFAKDSVAVTEDDIKEFYEKGLAWWKSNINKGAYQF